MDGCEVDAAVPQTLQSVSSKQSSHVSSVHWSSVLTQTLLAYKRQAGNMKRI
jgi:hypothetical protein